MSDSAFSVFIQFFYTYLTKLICASQLIQINILQPLYLLLFERLKNRYKQEYQCEGALFVEFIPGLIYTKGEKTAELFIGRRN